MHSSSGLLGYLALAAISWAKPSYLAVDLSFGHEPRLSSDLSTIPNFRLLGEPSLPVILSNKLILTPPAPGNQRAAVWGDKPLRHSVWTADIDFRATGPDRGGGKFSIWLAKDGQVEVGTSSIYTVGKFDGLALTIDTYAGTAGMIRGFLNDGSTEYKSHHNVDSLAFGHCSYAYRNLGRPSQLKIRQDRQIFQVSIDDKLCFETTNIRLPVGYYFGIVGVSGDIPDSIEVNKLVVTTETYNFDAENQGLPPGSSNPGGSDEADQPPEYSDSTITAIDFNDPPEIDADKVETAKQFADLHNLLQAIMKHLVLLERNHNAGKKNTEQTLSAIHKMLSKQLYSSSSSSSAASLELLRGMDKRFQDMETQVKDMAFQVQRIKYALADTAHIEDLKQTVKDTHSSLLSAAPRHGFFVFTLLGSQALLVLAYVLYKRKRANSPKKYL